MRVVHFALTSLILASCAETGGSEIVPIRTLLAETAGRPYECANYDRASDTCETLGRMTVRGRLIDFEIRTRQHFAPANVTERGELVIRVTSQIDGNVYCTTLSGAEISVAGTSDGDARRIVAAHRAALRQIGRTCTTYLRDGAHYRFVNASPSGFLADGPADRARFFAGPKPLRR